jgi:hypothetical protein
LAEETGRGNQDLFDTNHHVAVFLNYDNLAKAMEDLKAIVRTTFPAGANMVDNEEG